MRRHYKPTHDPSRWGNKVRVAATIRSSWARFQSRLTGQLQSLHDDRFPSPCFNITTRDSSYSHTKTLYPKTRVGGSGFGNLGHLGRFVLVRADLRTSGVRRRHFHRRPIGCRLTNGSPYSRPCHAYALPSQLALYTLACLVSLFRTGSVCHH